MQLTRAADYAVRVMIHLASRPEGSVVSKTVLANASEAPESFVSKILQMLARAGLIQARRGVEGGFLLLPRGAEASLLDVVESIDGPIALNICINAGNCRRDADCAAHQVWLQAQTAMLAVLREAKIAEMAQAVKSCGKARNIARISAGGKPESVTLSRQGGSAATTKGKVQPRTVPTGAGRAAGKKQK
ncbi:MAG: Rrf2 family transcriptional regulator [Candidatus Korobacteraceae bacterium]